MRHYKIISVSGNNPEQLLNSCLKKNIHISWVRYVSENEILIKISEEDYVEFCNIAGMRYNIYISGEEGVAYKLGLLWKRKIMLTGLLVFLGILFYQSLFIAEIEVMGYESINEQDLRKCMKDAGLYEGCRKNINISKVKLCMFEEFDNISWIGIKYKGNLAQVTIAETDELYKKTVVQDTSPCNIVAEKCGYIDSVDPEEGMRAVENGQYVREGDVLISGVIPLAKTTYEEGSEDDTETYVHAAGTVKAKIPVRLNFYRQSYETIMEETGKSMITVSVNDHEFMKNLCQYETSQVKRYVICNFTKPVRIKIQVNYIEEVNVINEKITANDIQNEVLNEIHEFVKEKLPDNAQILNKSLNFTQEKNIIRVGVTLETLQQIGIEEEIIVDKSNRQSEKDDDQ